MFDDADLEQAVNGAVSGIFAATGQTCIAGSRLLVQDTIHDEFVEKLLAVREARQHGRSDGPGHAGRPDRDPAAVREGLEYIDIAQGEGASCVLGGRRLTGPSAAMAGSSSRPSSPA